MVIWVDWLARHVGQRPLCMNEIKSKMARGSQTIDLKGR